MYQSMSRYRVLERLGSGGEGQVWKAEDLRLKRTVAIKFLAADLYGDEEAKKRLGREAQMAAALTHPNIATVYEVIEADERLCMIMECVEGETLKSRVESGPLGVNAALDVAIQVAEALKAAHARGLIHCDIKSSNIMLTAGGQAKVLDFGLARIAAASRTDPSREVVRTRQRRDGIGILVERDSVQESTAIAGTPGYMSPEQVRGETLDGRTDIFSLGVVLYEMLTAGSPFQGGRPVEVLQSVLNDEPPSLSAVCDDAPLELESIVRRALAKRRDERYAAAADLLSDLRALKHQLENREAVAVSFIAGARSVIALPDATFVLEPDRAETLRRVARRYRRWLLAGSVFAGSMAVLDIITLQSHGGKWTKSAALLACAAIFALGYAAARKKATRALPAIPSGAAFRGLLPFQEADRDRFYGRESDIAALFEMIRHSDFRFGVLFGESGCGKTSLLRAGLMPKLWEEGYLPILCRSYKDPLAAALEECRRRSQVDVLEDERPGQYLRRVSREIGARLVIVCDQFEEFFVSHKSKEEREPFLSFIAASHDDSDLPVTFLVSMRSDFLYLISLELGGRIAEPLISSGLFHLRKFDEQQAIEIIERSAHRAGLPFEQGFSHHVARDLATGDVVSPSEMQIVGEQLQSKRIYTVQAYRRAGGKEPLVHSFLEDVIRASGDADGARLLLRSLISDENTRVTLPQDEIARRTQRSAASVERLLRMFVKSRLIREIQDETPWRYELMHEYLIEKINQVTGSVMDATQRANRLLRQYLSDYSIDKGTRIPIARLWFIRRYSDIARGERERQFMEKSLRSGVVKAVGAGLLLAIAATLVAGALSVRDEWQGVRLSDGHAAAVRRAVFSPDGSRLVTSGEDGKIIIWNFASRDRIATLDYCSMELIASGYLPNGIALAYSPDGKWIASAGEHDAVIVWDALQFSKVAILGGHGDQPSTIGFSPDGKYLLTSSSGGNRTIIWEAGRWNKLRVVPDASGAPSFLFSPDGSRFIFAEPLSAWDLATGKQVSDEIDDDHRVSRSAISHDGSRIVGLQSGSRACFFKPGDWAKGVKPQLIAVKEAHRYFARDVAFSPDGRMVATGSEDIALWDVETQTILARFEHTDNVWSLAFSRDGRWLVSTHGDGAILLWDIAERRRVANFNEHSDAVMALRFSPDGKRVASAGKDQSLILWNAETGKKQATLILNEFASIKRGEGIFNINFSNDEKSLVGVSDVQVLLSDIATLGSRIIFNTDPVKGEWVAAVSPDFRWIATNRAVYKVADGQKVTEFDREVFATGLSFNAMTFSPDGRWLLRANFTGDVYIWDTQDWRLAAEQKMPDTRLVKAAFSPDSSLFVTGSVDGEVRLWQTMPLRQVGLLGKHQSIVLALAFSPDGGEVVSSGDDRTIALWDVDRRKLKTYIGQQNASVLSLAISPDGQRLACGGQDRSVRIYSRHRTLWGYRLD
jgi:WD40 repeat protein/tRNA A-37 threonylcarbamoyl transferase component Bud32